MARTKTVTPSGASVVSAALSAAAGRTARSLSLALAPAALRSLADSRSPALTANVNGVNPTTDRACTSAPWAIRSWTNAECASAAAVISIVCPLSDSVALMSAPCAISTFTASTLSVRTTVMRAVSPSVRASGSAPASTAPNGFFARRCTSCRLSSTHAAALYYGVSNKRIRLSQFVTRADVGQLATGRSHLAGWLESHGVRDKAVQGGPGLPHGDEDLLRYGLGPVGRPNPKHVLARRLEGRCDRRRALLRFSRGLQRHTGRARLPKAARPRLRSL